jgi:hypothetical protein
MPITNDNPTGSCWDQYTPNGIYTAYEDHLANGHDVGDRSRLFWDHPKFPQQWSSCTAFAHVPILDPPDMPMRKELRFILSEDFAEWSNTLNRLSDSDLVFTSPSILSNGHRKDRLLPTTQSFKNAITIVATHVQQANVDLMRWLASHPDDLKRIHPGTFEEVISELFRANGYETELVGRWNQGDGGIDIIAIRKDSLLKEMRIGIQCKRNFKTRFVKADIVWALLGRLDKFKLNHGAIATTGVFENSVLRETEEHLWRIDLLDFQAIAKQLGQTYSRDSSSGLYLP